MTVLGGIEKVGGSVPELGLLVYRVVSGRGSGLIKPPIAVAADVLGAWGWDPNPWRGPGHGPEAVVAEGAGAIG
jgi:hypothetical protein